MNCLKEILSITLSFISKNISSFINVGLSALFTIVWTKFKYFKYDVSNNTPSVDVFASRKSDLTKAIFKSSILYETNLDVKCDEEGKEKPLYTFKKIIDPNYDYKSKFLVKIKSIDPSTSDIQYIVDKKHGKLPIDDQFDFSSLENDMNISLVFQLKEKPSKIIMNFKNLKLTYNIWQKHKGTIIPEITSQKTKRKWRNNE